MGDGLKGTEDMMKTINQLLTGPFANIFIDTTIEKIRFVRPDVAVIISRRTQRNAQPGTPENRMVEVLSKEAANGC